MRLAVFGDIHGNSVALDAVLEDMDRQGVDAKICLGDVAFRGPDPVGSLERVFGAGLQGLIIGNTDQWLYQGFPAGFAPGEEKRRRLETFLAWSRERIGGAGGDDLQHLRGLPHSTAFRLGGHSATVVHSSPVSTEDWYDAAFGDQDLIPIFEKAGACDILVYGHIHTPFVRRINRRWLVNTGSVGNPIDGDYRASYALFTENEGGLGIEIRRVAYDVHRVIRQAHEAEFPFAKEYGEAIRCGAPV